MANSDNAVGLTPACMIDGSPYNGATRRFYHPSTDSNAIYIGQPVKSAGSADADGIMTVTGNVSTGNPLVGVCVSVEPVTRDSTPYCEASTARYINVAVAADILYEVQCNGTLTATMIGNACDASTMTTGTTTTGRSLIEADLGTVTAAGDATEDFVIWGLVQRPDNALGADAKVLVRLNNHTMVDGFAGA